MGVILLVFIISLTTAFAYRQGDAIGILLRTHTPSSGSNTLEAYRHQLPRFGVDTRTRFDVSALLNNDDIKFNFGEDNAKQQPSQRQRGNKKASDGEETLNEHLRLSVAFDEAYHHIPWLDVYNPSTKHNKEKMLQNLIITIVYSSSDGSIHAIHRETKYQDNSGGGVLNKKSFTVEYIWINEADVDLQGGLLAMFFVVLLVSLAGMVGSCTSSTYYDGSNARGKKYNKEKHSSSSLETDGFAKRL